MSDTVKDSGAFLDSKMTEKEWLSQVLQLARANNWLCYHTRDARRSDPGFPDLVMVRDGRLIFAELKTEKGRMSKAQINWAWELRQVAGLHVQVWRPSDWPQVEAALVAGAEEGT